MVDGHKVDSGTTVGGKRETDGISRAGYKCKDNDKAPHFRVAIISLHKCTSHENNACQMLVQQNPVQPESEILVSVFLVFSGAARASRLPLCMLARADSSIYPCKNLVRREVPLFSCRHISAHVSLWPYQPGKP